MGYSFLAGLLLQLICWTAAAQHGEYIIGGQDADEGEYPWQAKLYYYNLPMCGATLISPEFLLTSAHCAGDIDLTKLEVYLGMHDIYWKEQGQVEIHHVSQVILNPDYVFTRTMLAGDLAVMRLSAPVNMSNPFIDVVQLVESGANFTGQHCTMTGWGRMKWIHPNLLQEAEVQVSSLQKCRNMYRNTIHYVRDDMLCAGHLTKRGGCEGDAGNPLLCSVDGRWQQAAVVSWLMPPCNTDYDTVMTSVSVYRKWIHDVTGI